MQRDVIEGFCNIVTDALSTALCRLEINDYEGEEESAMQDVSAALAAMRDLAPILAAAPAMLAALQAMTRDNRADNDGETVALLVKAETYQAALDAIALATGAPTDETEGACASCGAPEGESHLIGCEARGFAIGAAAARHGGEG